MSDRWIRRAALLSLPVSLRIEPFNTININISIRTRMANPNVTSQVDGCDISLVSYEVRAGLSATLLLAPTQPCFQKLLKYCFI